MPNLFTLQNTSLQKSGITVLNDLSFELETHQHLAIMGNSGSGKSTLLDVFAKKIFPTSGKFISKSHIKVVSVPRDYGFHKIVGSAYQYYQQRYTAMDAEIGPTLSEVIQNQIQPLWTVNANSVEHLAPQYTEQEVNHVCQLFDLQHLLNKKITSLSNGETRRSLLAISLLKKPDVLLLDEPFSGLDTQHRSQLKTILENLTNVQIIIVTNQNDWPSNISYVLKLNHSKLDFFGTKDAFSTAYPPESGEFSKATKRDFPIFNTPKSDFETALILKNGSVKYGEKQVLKGLNWQVQKGERWALMGPNGSGKSSLLSLITGDNLQCYNNDLYIFDKKRGSGESIWELKSNIGYVSPELHLYFNKGIRVWKVLASGFFDTIGLFKSLNQAQETHVEAMLTYFALQHLKERQLSQLSFSEQRMVLLARALIKNPALLILDEPCQGLDYDQMLKFRNLVDSICTQTHTTLIYVSHYIDEIPACVQKTLYLEDGQVLRIAEK